MRSRAISFTAATARKRFGFFFLATSPTSPESTPDTRDNNLNAVFCAIISKVEVLADD
jgi:hypothetical protein